jgi:hypothetical protein
VKRLLCLIAVALMVMLILVPTAMAQESTLPASGGQTQPLPATGGQESTQPLPASGGVGIGTPAVLLPAAALLLGGSILGYAYLRRR